jgi:excisionase family DNA binding protein
MARARLEPYYTPEEVADLLGVAVDRVLKAIDDGRIQAEADPAGPVILGSCIDALVEQGRTLDGRSSPVLIRQPRVHGGSDGLRMRRAVPSLAEADAPAASVSYEHWLTPSRRPAPVLPAPLPESEVIFGELFGVSDSNSTLSQGRIYPQSQPHPDNVAADDALHSPLGFTARKLVSVTEKDVMPVLPDGDVILVGGPNSTLLTRIAWEFDGPNERQLTRTAEPILKLRYFGLSNAMDPSLRGDKAIGWRLEHVGPVATVNWAIMDTVRKRTLRPQPSSNVLMVPSTDAASLSTIEAHLPADNYLVVTRLPNFLHPDFLQQSSDEWCRLVAFAGNHGLGTRAANLLTDTRGLRLLESAKAVTRGSTAFQLLFRATDLDVVADPDMDFHMFASLELEEIHVLDDVLSAKSLAAAHTRAKEQWHRVTAEH